jgi:hypothetical protein
MASVGLRGVVDGALAHVGEVACGCSEVFAVVEHHQVVLGCVITIAGRAVAR